jgi:hypothetical protein
MLTYKGIMRFEVEILLSRGSEEICLRVEPVVWTA